MKQCLFPFFPLFLSPFSPFFSSLFLSFPFSLFLPLSFSLSFSLSLSSSFPFLFSLPFPLFSFLSPFSPSRFLLSFPIFGVRGGSLPPCPPIGYAPACRPMSSKASTRYLPISINRKKEGGHSYVQGYGLHFNRPNTCNAEMDPGFAKKKGLSVEIGGNWLI